MRAISVILGFLFIATGIYCFFNLGVAFASLTFIWGIIMMIYGIGQITAWFSARKINGASGWIAVEGIFTALVGLLIAFYPLSQLFLAIWFGAWLIVSGIIRIVASLQSKRNLPNAPWGFMMFMGILTMIVGIYGIIHPIVIGMAIAMLFGIFFILQGINAIIFGLGHTQPRKTIE